MRIAGFTPSRATHKQELAHSVPPCVSRGLLFEAFRRLVLETSFQRSATVSEYRPSAARHSASGSPSSFRTMFVPSTIDTILYAGVPPPHAFAAHAAIGRDDQPLGRNVLQRLADQRRDLVRALDLQGVMVDDADHDLLVRDDLADRLQIAGADEQVSNVSASAST